MNKVVLFGLALAFWATGNCYAADTYDSLFKDMLANVKEVVTALKTVKDADTAKTAMPKLKKLKESFEDLGKRQMKLGKPGPEDKAVIEKFLKEVAVVQKDIEAEADRLKKVKGAEEVIKFMEFDKKPPEKKD